MRSHVKYRWIGIPGSKQYTALMPTSTMATTTTKPLPSLPPVVTQPVRVFIHLHEREREREREL
jgi:hypothetical protein